MDISFIEAENTNYIEIRSRQTPIGSEQDALELIGLCAEKGTRLLMLHSAALSNDFFKLRTGVAGAVLQKLVNYSVKIAVVISNQGIFSAMFKEMASEANKGSHFRVFDTREAAEAWLTTVGAH